MTSSMVGRMILGVAACVLMACGGAPVGVTTADPVVEGDARADVAVDAGAVVDEDAAPVVVADSGSTPAQDAGGEAQAPDAHVATPDAAPSQDAAALMPDAGMPEAAPAEAAAPIVVVCEVSTSCGTSCTYLRPYTCTGQSLDDGIHYQPFGSCSPGYPPTAACPTGTQCTVYAGLNILIGSCK